MKKRTKRTSTLKKKEAPKTPLHATLTSPDPDLCPYCQRPFSLVVGCHKICECGYMEGCED